MIGRGLLLYFGLLLLNGCVSSKKFDTLQRSKTEVQNTYTLHKVESERRQQILENKINDQRDGMIKQNTLISQLITDKDKLVKDLEILNQKLGSVSSEAENIQQALYTELQKQNEELAQKEARLGLIIETYNLANEKVFGIFQEVTAQLNKVSDDVLETSLSQLSFTLAFNADYLFGNDLSIKPGSAKNLQLMVNVLKSYPEVLILVEGHTDNQALKSSRLYRDAFDLSTLRAANAARFMIKEAGINANQVTWSGKAGFSPKVSNETQAGRRLNNRVEIIIAYGIDEVLKLINND